MISPFQYPEFRTAPNRRVTDTCLPSPASGGYLGWLQHAVAAQPGDTGVRPGVGELAFLAHAEAVLAFLVDVQLRAGMPTRFKARYIPTLFSASAMVSSPAWTRNTGGVRARMFICSARRPVSFLTR